MTKLGARERGYTSQRDAIVKEKEMSGGYMGKILFVDLSSGAIKEETLEEKMCRDFIGGYGIGTRILYSRQKAGADPLGPENTLGLISGPLTGTLVPTGARYAAVAKSPLTGGWGDANSGGDFGPYSISQYPYISAIWRCCNWDRPVG